MSRSAVGILVASTAMILLPSFALSASAATCPTLTHTLKRGDTDATTRGEVSKLQQSLISQGLLSADSANNPFGPRTEKAVQALQKLRNIVSSGTPASTGYGVVGPKTRRAISLLCAHPGAVPTAYIRKIAPPSSLQPNCPLVALPIGKACSGKWKEVKDANKCTASWQCVAK